MVRFIIYEDNVTMLEQEQLIVNKVCMGEDFDYKVDKFATYDPSIEKIINSNTDQKIYILDVEVPKVSGLEIASKIRDRDWDSMIIFVTSHPECKDDIFYSRLMVLDFISKTMNFRERLEKSIRVALDSFNKNKFLVFKFNQITYRLLLDSIIYIEKIPRGVNSLIVTDSEQYEIPLSLSKVKELLDDRFFQTHKSCLVNVDHVRSVNSSINEIRFDTGDVINWLSERNKKDFVEYVRNYRR